MDNMDHDPSSTTAQSSFHGTGINLTQFPSADDMGTAVEPVITVATERLDLPHSYTIAFLWKNQEICMEHLECISRCEHCYSLLWLKILTIKVNLTSSFFLLLESSTVLLVTKAVLWGQLMKLEWICSAKEIQVWRTCPLTQLHVYNTILYSFHVSFCSPFNR